MIGSFPRGDIDSASKIASVVAKQTESIILEQLNALIGRGILVIESTQPMLVHSSMEDKIEIRQGVRLVLNNEKYVKDLEAEVVKWRDLAERAVAKAGEFADQLVKRC